MKVIKVCLSDWISASRDKRELSALSEIGHECFVMSKGQIGDMGRKTSISGFDVYLYSTKPLGNRRMFRSLNRVLSIFLWSHHLRKFKADVLSCHDLGALFIGWLSTLFVLKMNKPHLVYDSHEFEIGRYEKTSKLFKFAITIIERFLIRKCSLSMMVNESISKEVTRIHKLKTPPVVIRNIPYNWTIDTDIIQTTRIELLEKNKLSTDSFVVMYHGSVIENRGIESLLNVVAINPNIVGVILGNGSKEYILNLINLIENHGIRDRIVFQQAVPINELWKYVGFANVGLVLIQNTCMNHYYSLPNKLFENIQSCTPVIGSNFPEIKGIVEKYEIGFSCNPSDISQINEFIEKIRSDLELNRRLECNLEKAKHELCWENEKKVLIKAFEEILAEKL